MNGKEMMNLPQLKEVLLLKAGEKGLNHQIRWIYFADCFQCVKSEYRMEDYIHGGEFAVVEFAFEKLELGEQIRHAIEREVAFYLPEKLLFLLQTGSVLALLPEERLKDFKLVLKETVQKVQRNYDRSLKQLLPVGKRS